MVTGLIPGAIGETSVIAIAIGAVILLWSGVASWKTMLSVFVGGAVMGWVFNQWGPDTAVAHIFVGGAVMGWVFNQWGPDTAVAHMPWYEHLCLGGFCFGAVFMATDPVTSSRTENGKFVYGFLIGAMAIIIRVLNPGYPEGMMLAILLMNIFAPLIDYVVVQNNYASVLVIIVAFLLAFVNSSLRDLQGKNVELDTKKQILSSLGIREVEDPEAKFAEVVKEDMLVAEDGSLKPYEGSFVTGYEKAYKEKGEAWGAIWGYVALNEDKNTVYGTYFSHASETPGLGAEIATENFQNEFKGKNVMDGNAIGLDVVKNGKVEKPEFQVDGISGGTITSVAVGQMLKSCMGHYTNFLTTK